MPKNKPEIKVTTKEEAMPDLEILAEHIKQLSELGKKLKNSKLKENTILLLIKDHTGIPKHQIKRILDALPELEKIYLK